MKTKLIVLLAAMLPLVALSQTKLTAQKQAQVIQKIDRSAAAMKSMQCTFTQTKSMKMLSKKMTSKGVMYFKSPNKLRWQYTSPYSYTFLMNGDKVRLVSNKSTQNVDVRRNKMFRQITNIILNSITGGNLSKTSDFTVVLYKDGGAYYAQMYPKKKELKQLYKYIRIRFNAALTMVTTVEMVEKTGDTTVVTLTNVKTNHAINESVFAIR